MGVFFKKGNWYIDYRLPNGRRIRQKIGSSKKLAENVLRKRKLEIAENKFLDIKKNPPIKFEDFAQEFLEIYSKPNKKSWESDFHHLKRLKSFFRGKFLYQITPKDIEEFKAIRVRQVKPATVNRELATLKTMFNKAVEWGKFQNSPAKNVKFLKEDNKRLRYLEREEIKRLIEACPPDLRPIVIIALNTGMRKGEILNLKWHNIDFKRGIIYLLDTKNGEKREVYMNDTVKRTLIRVRKHPDSPYVFCRKDGKPIKDIRKSFFTALKKAGIMNFRFHDLRHTFASQLVMNGVDLKTVQELMGHKDIRMTLRYSHLSADYKRRAVEVLDKRLDTFWTPEEEIKEAVKFVNSEVIDNKEVITREVAQSGLAHLNGVQGVAGSNPALPMLFDNVKT